MTELNLVKKEETDSGSDGDHGETVEEQVVQPQESWPRKTQPIPPPITINLLNPNHDRVHQNIHILTQDLLYLCELVWAISDRDIGHIEDILPHLAMIFHGAGSNNYCTEILHFILNVKYIWTPEFAWVDFS